MTLNTLHAYILPLKSDVSFFNVFIESIYNEWYDFYKSNSITYEDIVKFYKEKIDNVFILAYDTKDSQEFMGCYSIYRIQGLIADILIIKKYRGRGYGRILMNDVLHKLRYNLFSYLYCEDKNINFYKKYGFVLIYKSDSSKNAYNLMVRFNMVMILVLIIMICLILIILSKFF